MHCLKLSILISAALFIGACSTPFPNEQFTGDFAVTQIDPITFRVTSHKSLYSSPNTLTDYALHEAAVVIAGHRGSRFQITQTFDSKGRIVHSEKTFTVKMTGRQVAGEPLGRSVIVVIPATDYAADYDRG